NTLDLDLFLRISPELYLKRLVVGGLDRVFEISRNFRNEGIDSTHFPEFTILEFYQAYATYTDLMDLTEEMLVGVSRETVGTLLHRWREMDIDLTPPWPRRTMVELVAERAGVPPDQLLDPAVLTGVAERTGGVERSGMSPGDLLGLCFERLVEPELIQPTFVTQFPVEMSPLARRNERDPRFVDRFELFVGRTEFANAFSELNDPEDQRARFEDQLVARAAGDEEAQMMDEDYVQALEYGLPPTAGGGVGVDRLGLLVTGAAALPEPAPGGPVMSWELLVGIRYLRSRRRSFLSLISALSLAGVTIGVATLLIVLAVMTGLEYDLRQKILGFNPHVTLASFSGGLA